MAGAVVAYINLKRLGQQRKANLTLGFTILGCVVLFLILDKLPLQAAEGFGWFVGNIVSPFLFPMIQKSDFEQWESNNAELTPHSGWKSLGWGIVGLVAFVVLLAVTGIVVVLTEGEVENINVNVQVPSAVATGEEFVLEIQIENTAERAQRLHSIDIEESYMEGITIQSAEPLFSTSEHNLFDNTRSYGFDQSIPPKTKLVVKFHAMARKPGVFESDVDVCINSATKCLMDYPIATQVGAEK